MIIRYEQHRADVVEATKQMSRNRLIYIFLGCWTFAALIQSVDVIRAMNAGANVHEASRGRVSGIMTLSLLSILVAFLIWYAPRAAAKKVILRTVSWDISEDAVQIDSDVSSSSVRWPAFVKYKETDKMFLLYVQKRQAHFIPKRVLNVDQLEQLRALLRNHITQQ